MRKYYALSIGELVDFAKTTFSMLAKGVLRIPCVMFLSMSSLTCWVANRIARFCKEYTKAATIIGFVLCFMLMFVEFVYFKIQLQKNSYKISELIKKNYELEQTDRYDIGYHDAMAKNKEMLIQNAKR